MDVEDAPFGKERGGIVEEAALVLLLLDEADDHRHPPSGVQELPEERVPGRVHRHVGDEVLQGIAGEAELGKDDELGAFGAGPGQGLQMPAEVRPDVAEPRGHLNEVRFHIPKVAHFAGQVKRPLPGRGAPSGAVLPCK